MIQVKAWLADFFGYIFHLLNVPIIVIGNNEVSISLWNVFSCVFILWIARNIIGVLLDRHRGEV